MSVRCILTDIEGTTTPLSFVQDVLFPYSAAELPRFIRENSERSDVHACLGGLAPEAAIDQMLQYIREDRKDPHLKTLQGMIWRYGYESGAFTSILYPDVKPCFEAWRQLGIKLAIYSSGSVAAQKLLFRYSDHGDLTSLLTDYFDTGIGPKRERASYRAIACHLVLAPTQILFLSDIVEELDAAKAEGFQTTQIVRSDAQPQGGHSWAKSFYDLALHYESLAWRDGSHGSRLNSP